MASHSGMFLKRDERLSLIQELESKGELKPENIPVYSSSAAAAAAVNAPVETSFGTGCLYCAEDNDHANILLCEGCNDEYHTYCLDPPLRAVPSGDWYCSKCKVPSFQDDGLDQLVSALPPSYTSRFGEVCWAQGGNGFGYWPSLLYDPRLTVGSARQLAKKNLGKRHLVYFFECHDAPFAVMPESKIQRWEDGLIDDLHLGKAARSAGKARFQTFQQALQAATIEAGKPKEMRMDWNHNEPPSPGMASPNRQQSASKSRKRRREKVNSPRRKPRGFGFLTTPGSFSAGSRVSSTQNLMTSIERLLVASSNANTIESSQDGDLCCKLFKKTTTQDGDESSENIGFVKMNSKKTCTFADARIAIQDELVPEFIPAGTQWKFSLPTLGPVSSKQENSLGPLIQLLQSSAPDSSIVSGSVLRPLPIYIEFVSS